MFANIRRHQKWLWVLISGAVIISFVWYFNPNAGSGGGEVSFDSKVGTLNGRPIGRAEYMNARKEAELRYLFSYGTWHGSDDFSRQNPDFIDRETKTRLFLREKIKEHNINVTPAEVAKWIREVFGREKPFTPADYDRFLETLKARGVSESDLERYVRNELGAMHLAQVAGTPGRLVTPQEAESQYRQENEKVAVDAVFFNAADHLAQVKVEPALISAHYTNQAAMYRVPERIQLAYVAFDATNYLAQADQFLVGITNLNQIIDEIYKQRGASFYTDTNDVALPAELAKQRIKEEERKRLALVEARKAATAFAQELFDLPGTRQVANLENLAAARGIVAKTTEPFTQFDGPRGMDVPERFGQLAFMLTPGDPFIEEPIVGAESVYVGGLKKRIASEIPPLDSIRDKVTEDYKRIQSQVLARQAGQAAHAKLTNAMAAGKSFTAAATELGLNSVKLEHFNQLSRSIAGLDARIDPGSVKNAAFALKAGETSPFTFTRDGGFVLHVNSFLPVSDDQVKEALPPYLANLQRSGQAEAFNAWFGKEFQAAKLSLVTDEKSRSADGETENFGGQTTVQ